MIFDNPDCLRTAERLVEQFAGNRVELKKEISGELNRYFTLGKYAAISRVSKAVEAAEKARP